jgi:hypothetical protein
MLPRIAGWLVFLLLTPLALGWGVLIGKARPTLLDWSDRLFFLVFTFVNGFVDLGEGPEASMAPRWPNLVVLAVAVLSALFLFGNIWAAAGVWCVAGFAAGHLGSSGLVRRGTRTKSTHRLVASELRAVISLAVKRQAVAGGEKITRALKHDAMSWFRIRPREYGESGNHYGIAELTTDASVHRPKWLGLVPTSDLDKVWRQASELLDERRPLGGHMMDEENRCRAASEFADQLLFRLYEAEKQAREQPAGGAS